MLAIRFFIIFFIATTTYSPRSVGLAFVDQTVTTRKNNASTSDSSEPTRTTHRFMATHHIRAKVNQQKHHRATQREVL